MAPLDAYNYKTLHKQGSRLLYELDPEVTHLSLRNKQKARNCIISKIANLLANCEIKLPNSFDSNLFFYSRIQSPCDPYGISTGKTLTVSAGATGTISLESTARK